MTNLIKDLRQRLKSTGIDAGLIETVYGLGYRLKTAPTKGGGSQKFENIKAIEAKKLLWNLFCSLIGTVIGRLESSEE